MRSSSQTTCRYRTRSSLKTLSSMSFVSSVFLLGGLTYGALFSFSTTRWMIQVIAQGGTVFAHCSSASLLCFHAKRFILTQIRTLRTAGIASSSLLATAYLMASYHLDPNAAYSHVQGRRYCATVSPVSESGNERAKSIVDSFLESHCLHQAFMSQLKVRRLRSRLDLQP